jgi:uncharacterized membrane protein
MNNTNRINVIDNCRGVAFILMIIQHIPCFYDNTNNTNYSDNNVIKNIGMVARTIFIFLAGLSISIEYKKYNKKKIISPHIIESSNTGNKDFTLSRTKRSVEILTHALIISCITYTYYKDRYVRFGILHFIGLSTLIASLFAPNKKLSIIVLILLIVFKGVLNHKLANLGQVYDTILGGDVHYKMMDWFPLLDWFPLILFGLVVGQQIDITKLNRLEKDNKLLLFLNKHSILTEIGKNSLVLYTCHFVIFSILFTKYKLRVGKS